MSAPDPDRLARLENRVAELEARLAALAPDGAPAGAAATASDVVATAAATAAPVPPVPAASSAWPVPPGPAAAPTSLWGQPARDAAAAKAAKAAAAKAATGAPVASRSFADLEEQLSGRVLAWVGGIALVLGAMFFLSLAFSRGWIGPEARVLIGLVAGAAALLAGAWLFERGDRTPAQVLTGVGVGTGSLALFAASRLYGFIPVEPALLGFLVLAVGTAAIALRGNSQAVAVFGIVATTAAPPILGASPTLVTVAFLGAAIVGTAVISFNRSWPWLALLAFMMSAPQAANWFSTESNTTLAIAGIGAFWTVNAFAAAGSALAGLRPTVHRANATLLVLNALVAIGAFHLVLPADPFARSTGVLILAGLHGALALPLLLGSPRRHPFGVLAAGLAAGTLAIGIATELGGIAQPIAHTALATAVAWVAIRFRDRSAAAWAAAIGSLAVLHLVAIDYPVWKIARVGSAGASFASPEWVAAIVIAAALALTGVVAWHSFTAAPLRSPRWTAELALVGGFLGSIAVVAYGAEFELRADLRIVTWAILAVASLALAALLRVDRQAWRLAGIEGAVLIAAGGLVTLALVAPPRRLLVDPNRAVDIIPLLNGASMALAALAVALAIAAWVVIRWSPTRPIGRSLPPAAAAAAAIDGSVIVYLASIAIVDAFQARIGPGVASEEIATQAQVALSIAWVLVGAGAFATGLVRGIGLARVFGLGLLAVATGKVFLFDLAALDVAYRVLSFLGLGGVLLASSFVAARFRSRTAPIAEPGPSAGSEPGEA